MAASAPLIIARHIPENAANRITDRKQFIHSNLTAHHILSLILCHLIVTQNGLVICGRVQPSSVS
jgi:hypothetical protein